MDKDKSLVKGLAFNERGILFPKKRGLEEKEVGEAGQLEVGGQGTEVVHA